MKKLILLAILLINGSYLFSMKRPLEDIEEFEKVKKTKIEQKENLFEQLPIEIQAMILDLGLIDAIKSAPSIPQAIQNIYNLKQVNKQWYDIWIELMKNEKVTQYLISELITASSSTGSLTGSLFKKFMEEMTPTTKEQKEEQIYILGSEPPSYNDIIKLVLLLLGTDGAIKLLQTTYYENPEKIDDLIKWYAYMKPKNIKTIAHLKDVAHKAFGFEQYAQLPRDIQKVIAEHGFKHAVTSAIQRANTIQEAVKNIYALKLDSTWKQVWEKLLNDRDYSFNINHQLELEFENQLTNQLSAKTEEQKYVAEGIVATYNELKPDFLRYNAEYLINLDCDYRYIMMFPFLLLGTKQALQNLDYEFTNEEIEILIKWYSYMQPQDKDTLERLQQSFEKISGHRVNLSDIPKIIEHYYESSSSESESDVE